MYIKDLSAHSLGSIQVHNDQDFKKQGRKLSVRT